MQLRYVLPAAPRLRVNGKKNWPHRKHVSTGMDSVMIKTDDLRWSWQGHEIVLGLDEAGSGPLVLLFPALSSISTRSEMHPLMKRLASQFRVVSIVG
jgi:hypothetical protein